MTKSRTQYDLVFSEIRNRPAQPYGGLKALVIVLVELHAGIRRVRTHGDHLGEGARRRHGVPHGVEVRPGNAESTTEAACRRGRASPFIKRHADPVPTDADVQSEVRGHLEIVLDEPARVTLHPGPAVGVRNPRRVLAVGDAKSLEDRRNRAGEVGKQARRQGLVRRNESRNRIDALYRRAARA